jgi:Mu-like prophage major head subunit gpT
MEILEQQTEALKTIQLQRKEIDRSLAEIRLQQAQLTLDKRLQESGLPMAVCKTLKERYAGRAFEAADLERDIQQAAKMMAQLIRDGIVRDYGYGKGQITSQITEAEKVQAAFDLMVEVEIDRAKLGNIRPFTSIREAYARVTGDPQLHAGISSLSQLGQIHIHESAPIERITEADTTTASFSYLLGTSMNKRLLKDYQAWPAEWMKFSTLAPIRDYKQQTRVRLGAFGSLAVVPEDTSYSAVTLTDSAATYVPQKRGNLVTVSRETIINDDLQAIKQIPTKLAAAAAYTLAEFVYGFLSTNPTIYDGNVLFTSGGAHNNLGSSALSSGAMQSGITAMREQTNFAGKRLGLRPRFLVVPPELEFTAMVVTKSAGVPGSNNNDINPMLGYVTPIVSPQLTNTTQWFLIGDPREIDTIEIGFVGGQVNPALFIQDQPLLGLNFTADVITYKIRHEYGGTVVDYRGMYRGI